MGPLQFCPRQSHRPTRRQERSQLGFRTVRRAQGFLEFHASITNLHGAPRSTLPANGSWKAVVQLAAIAPRPLLPRTNCQNPFRSFLSTGGCPDPIEGVGQATGGEIQVLGRAPPDRSGRRDSWSCRCGRGQGPKLLWGPFCPSGLFVPFGDLEQLDDLLVGEFPFAPAVSLILRPHPLLFRGPHCLGQTNRYCPVSSGPPPPLPTNGRPPRVLKRVHLGEARRPAW